MEQDDLQKLLDRLIMERMGYGDDALLLASMMNNALIKSGGSKKRIRRLDDAKDLSEAETKIVLKRLEQSSYRTEADTARAAALARKAS